MSLPETVYLWVREEVHDILSGITYPERLPTIEELVAYAESRGLRVAGPDDLVIRREDAWDETYKLQRSFNPPSDMSLNEKQAWKEGLYHALDVWRGFLAAAEGTTSQYQSDTELVVAEGGEE